MLANIHTCLLSHMHTCMHATAIGNVCIRPTCSMNACNFKSSLAATGVLFMLLRLNVMVHAHMHASVHVSMRVYEHASV